MADEYLAGDVEWWRGSLARKRRPRPNKPPIVVAYEAQKRAAEWRQVRRIAAVVCSIQLLWCAVFIWAWMRLE